MMVVGHQIVYDDILATCFAPAFQHGDEITMALKPLHLDYACGTDRNDQAERDLRPLARRRLITARPERGAHAQAEAVLHVATTVVRLERPLHNPLLLGLFGNASRCPHVSQAIPKYSHPYPQVKTDGVFSHFDTLRDTPQISYNRRNTNHSRPKVIHKLHVCYSQSSYFNTRHGG